MGSKKNRKRNQKAKEMSTNRSDDWKIKNVITYNNDARLKYDHPCQRNVGVWTKEQELYLIDSILQGYPIPSVYIYQKNDNEYIIIDGNQRINTIVKYFDPKSDYTLDFSRETAPDNYEWLASLYVYNVINRKEIYLKYTEIGEDCNGKQETIRIFNVDEKENKYSDYPCEINIVKDSALWGTKFKHPTYTQLVYIHKCLKFLRRKLKLSESMESFSGLIDHLNRAIVKLNEFRLSVRWIDFDEAKSGDEDSALAEAFYRLNHGKDLDPAERINGRCCADELWKKAQDFALNISNESKLQIYGYRMDNNVSDIDSISFFYEYNSINKRDVLLWGNLFLSAYCTIIKLLSNKGEDAVIGIDDLLYREWNVTAIKAGDRCDGYDYRAEEINMTDMDLSTEIYEIMKVVVEIAKSISVNSPTIRHKYIQVPVFLYGFYIAYKYKGLDPVGRITLDITLKEKISRKIIDLVGESNRAPLPLTKKLIRAIGL